jgi:hypothetical protein
MARERFFVLARQNWLGVELERCAKKGLPIQTSLKSNAGTTMHPPCKHEFFIPSYTMIQTQKKSNLTDLAFALCCSGVVYAPEKTVDKLTW